MTKISKKLKISSAFTMVELIFVIVIIGILSAVAIPKFRGLSSNAKVSAELAVASSVKTALDSANGEWSINEGDFHWGVNNLYTQDDINNTTGYPDDLNTTSVTLGKVVRNPAEWTCVSSDNNISIFTGPASDPNNGVNPSNERTNKPDKNDFWVYAFNANSCDITCTNCNQRTVHYGDFVLIDVNGTGSTPTDITCQ